MEIFKLFGSILVKNEDANKAILDTEKKGESLGHKMGGFFSGIGKAAGGMALGVAGAATAIVGGMGAAVIKTSEFAGEIDELSKRTGINAEELQRWKYAADQSGVSIDSFENGVKKLSTATENAKNGNQDVIASFDKLGVSLNDLQTMSPEQIFNDVVLGLADMEDGTAKNVLGNDLLGKSYTELMPLLSEGSGGIEELKNKAEELGLVMSEDMIAANEKFGDTLDTVKDSLKAIGMSIANSVLPFFQAFLDMILKGVPLIKETFAGMGSGFKETFGVIMETLGGLAKEIMPLILSNIEMVVPLIMDLVSNLLPVMVEIFTAFVDIIKPLAEAIIPALSEIFGVLINEVLPPLIELFMSIIETILPPLTSLFDFLAKEVIPVLVTLFKEIIETILPPLIEGFQKIVDGILPPLIELFTDIMKNILPIVIELFKDIIDNILPILGELFQFITDTVLPPLITLFKIIITDILPFVISLFKTIIDTILPPIITLFKALAELILPPVIAILGKLIEWIGKLIQALEPVFKTVLPLLQAAFEITFGVMGAVAKTAADTIKGVIDGLQTTFGGLIDFITGVFTGNWELAWQGVQDIFKGIFDGLSSIAKAPLNAIIGMINSVINGINSIDIPDWVPFAGESANIGTIPMLAKGGNITSSGSVMVGEKGPEILDLPTGARVTPLDKVGQNVTNNYLTFNVDFEKISDVQKLLKLVKDLKVTFQSSGTGEFN